MEKGCKLLKKQSTPTVVGLPVLARLLGMRNYTLGAEGFMLAILFNPFTIRNTAHATMKNSMHMFKKAPILMATSGTAAMLAAGSATTPFLSTT